ncbi:Alpha-methylacyl-CoA racemase [hydrothermal vent metagenome]|uniref:Alpha-methylacyl-CoA racemase n=1 Tax=hydrothermal vent metagenome TaxID=652676 RepID=A0A3B0VMR1_9ZZZZ
MTQPLASLKILDFSTLLPGPFGSMMLADLGADVLRVEAPHRPDAIRSLPPFDGETSAWHGVLNRNKRSIGLDLKQETAVSIIKQLITKGGYDIVLEQFRPSVMDRLGVGYDALSKFNPRLIYCAVTGYGQTGPYKDRAGHDNNYLALSGMMSHSGRLSSGPPPLGVQIADIGGGAFGAVTGILTAVIQRQVTGEGQLVDIAMLDMAIAWQAHAISPYLVAGELPQPEGWGLNGGSFYDYYETEDGRYLSVGSLEPKFWHGFCTAIGRSDLVPRAVDISLENQQALKAEIRQTILAKPLAAWTAIFTDLDVCVEPVLTIPEMLNHPQTEARGMVATVPKPDGSTQQQIASPHKFSCSEDRYRHIGTPSGAHTHEVLAELGYLPEEIATLREQGVLG